MVISLLWYNNFFSLSIKTHFEKKITKQELSKLEYSCSDPETAFKDVIVTIVTEQQKQFLSILNGRKEFSQRTCVIIVAVLVNM